MAKSLREDASSVAPSSRLGPLGDALGTERARPGLPQTARRKPGGMWEVVRGRLLYPAILAGLAFAARIVSRKKDELR